MSRKTLHLRRYTPEALAKYFHVPVDWVRSALMSGARTDRDLWNHIRDIARERKL